MLKLEIILAENDVMNISEGLKEIGVGGLTVVKVRGRGAKTAAEIHSSKGMEIFVPHFADKYLYKFINRVFHFTFCSVSP